jgi:hypothetical protein
LAAAVVAALTVLGGASLLMIRSFDTPDQTPRAAADQTTPVATMPSGDVDRGSGAFSCVEPYGPQTLAKRGFAFDGTITDIGKPWPRATLCRTSPSCSA